MSRESKRIYFTATINLFAFGALVGLMQDVRWWGILVALSAAVAVYDIVFLRHAQHKMPVIIFLWCMILSAIVGLVFVMGQSIGPIGMFFLVFFLLLPTIALLVLAAVFMLLVASLRQKSHVASVVNGVVVLTFLSIPLTAKYFAAAFDFLLRPFGSLASDLGATLPMGVEFIYALAFPMFLASLAYFALALGTPSAVASTENRQ